MVCLVSEFGRKRSFITSLRPVEYEHLVDQLKTLANESNPTKPQMVSVDKIGDVHELRVKGGPLGKKNMRLFFFVEKQSIVVLGCLKKETEGSLPTATRKLMEVRKRKFLAGVYGDVE